MTTSAKPRQKTAEGKSPAQTVTRSQAAPQTTDWQPGDQRLSHRGDPVWELAYRWPKQGDWTEADYLRLEPSAFVELVNGCVEFLPMPNPYHQFLVKYFARILDDYVTHHCLGSVLFAPCPIRLPTDNCREPDVLFASPKQLTDPSVAPAGAELVMEVISPGEEARQRDLVDKRRDYALAGIKEYWIVDPETNTVTVLKLKRKTYVEHGIFAIGEIATSHLLKKFTVDVAALFAAGQGGSRGKAD